MADANIEYVVGDMRGGFIRVTFSDSDIPGVRVVDTLREMGQKFFGESAPLMVERVDALPAPLATAPKDDVIGRLTPHPTRGGYAFLCLTCARPGVDTGARIYGVNLNPYKAVCCRCHRTVVEGCGTELFTGIVPKPPADDSYLPASSDPAKDRDLPPAAYNDGK